VTALAVALGLTTALGCGEVFTSTPGTGGGGTTTSTSSTTSTSGTSTSASTGIGGGGAGGAGQAGSGVGGGPGGAGGALPTLECDGTLGQGWVYLPNPAFAGEPFDVVYWTTATGQYGWSYMKFFAHQVTGTGQPEVHLENGDDVTVIDWEGNPAWRSTVWNHGPGVVELTVAENCGPVCREVSTCQVLVVEAEH
jgi:hypothetical protein